MSKAASGHKRGFTPIGLNMTETAVHAAQFRVENGDTELAAVDSYDIPIVDERRNEHAALQALADSGLFEGRDVISSLPNAEVAVRKIMLPPGTNAGDPDELMEALTLEARSVLAYGPENAVLDYVPIGTEAVGDKERQVCLLVALNRETVNRHMALLKSAGFRCGHLDLAPCAAARILVDENTQIGWAVADLDEENTTFSVMAGRSLVFSRTFKVGARMLTEQLSNSLKIEPAEARYLLLNYGVDHDTPASIQLNRVDDSGSLDRGTTAAMVFEIVSPVLKTLAREISRSIDYFMRQPEGIPVTRVVLLGGLVPKNIGKFLAKKLAINVDDAARIEPTSLDDEEGPRNGPVYAIAAGLALRS